MTEPDHADHVRLTPEEERALLHRHAVALLADPKFREESRLIKRRIDSGQSPDHPRIADGVRHGRSE